jgi:hypothetical protein
MEMRKAGISADFLASLLERFSNNLVPTGYTAMTVLAHSQIANHGVPQLSERASFWRGKWCSGYCEA